MVTFFYQFPIELLFFFYFLNLEQLYPNLTDQEMPEYHSHHTFSFVAHFEHKI